MMDPKRMCFYHPGHAKTFSHKAKLFEWVASQMAHVIRSDMNAVKNLPDDIIPVVGCALGLKPIIDEWNARGRNWIYWDRGYCRRFPYATDLPPGRHWGYYRWHLNSYQMQHIDVVPEDRWERLEQPVDEWQKNGTHIVLAEPSDTYLRFHQIENWTQQTIEEIKRYTDRPIVRRNKDMQISGARRLKTDLEGAHCLVTHGSNAAVEAVIMGCPVFVHPDSAASLVGLTDLSKIEEPIYPDRTPWLHALAYSQFTEAEFFDGTLWRLMA